MIQFEEVDYSDGDVDIIRGVSFRVDAGEKTVLTGPSGSGKSTVLKLAMGILKPSSGKIIIDNEELTEANLYEKRALMAYVDQEAVMGEELAREALLLPFQFKRYRNAEPGEERIEATLDRVGLGLDALDKRTVSLSGGERQRLAIARAMLLDKQVIVADEVTSALDSRNRRMINTMLLKEGWTLLAVSHDEEVVPEFDQVISLEQGRLVEVSS